MYKAYSLEPLFHDLPVSLSIESAAVYKDSILLGTKQGQLITFRVTEKPHGDGFDVKLRKTNKNFARRPITQLAVIEAYDILISLSDQVVSVHSMSENFELIQQFPKLRGANVFACGINLLEAQSENDVKKSVVMLRLCVAVRRKLYFFYWKSKENQFVEYPYDHTLPDMPRTIVWTSEDQLLVGFKADYILLKSNSTGHIENLFPPGKQPEPLLAKLTDKQFAMLTDNNVILVGPNGKPTKKYSIVLKDVPISLAYDYPNLIAISPSCVEVYCIDPRVAIQEIQIQQSPKPHSLIPWKSGRLFVISTKNVWCMVRSPIGEQLQACKEKKLFTLALELTNLLDTNDEEKSVCKMHIQNLLAFEHFVSRDFEKAFKIFESINTDPLYVIGLFPTLLKEQHRKVFRYPGPVPELGTDLRKALHLLIDYLKAIRSNIIKHSGDSVTVNGILEGNSSTRPKKQLLQIADTTILKCYLETNPSLVANLLRFRDNHCSLEESEAALLEHQKFAELVILYQQKNQHEKALELLFKQSELPHSPLHGHEQTVLYLQQLSVDKFDLMLKYSKWVLDAFPDDALKVFIEDSLGEVKNESKRRYNLPRDRVYQFLLKESPALVVPYLEHVILEWKDDNVYFHNMLIHKYREQILRKSDGDLNDSAIWPLREKLINFLRTSNRYTLSNFPQFFLDDKLYLECAIIMGKLGRHQDALTIYIHVLRNLKLAEEYCLEQYLKQRGSRDVFLILLSLCNKPAHVCLKALSIGAPAPTENLDILAVLDILEQHVEKLDPARAVEDIPPEIPLERLQSFLTRLLEVQTRKLSTLRIQNALLINDNIKAKEIKLELEKNPVRITDRTMCDMCGRPINRSVFVLTECSQIVHYACQKRDDII